MSFSGCLRGRSFRLCVPGYGSGANSVQSEREFGAVPARIWCEMCVNKARPWRPLALGQESGADEARIGRESGGGHPHAGAIRESCENRPRIWRESGMNSARMQCKSGVSRKRIRWPGHPHSGVMGVPLGFWDDAATRFWEEFGNVLGGVR